MGDEHSAAGPLGGYLWQLRKALVHLLGLDFGQAVVLERHDDICVVRLKNELLTAIQAKHSLNEGTLTLRSVELWKTLRVWSAMTLSSSSTTTKLILATTSGLNSELAMLGAGYAGRDQSSLDSVIQKLNRIAVKCPNKELSRCYSAWEKLEPDQRQELVSRITIESGSRKLSHISGELMNAVRKHHIPDDDLPAVTRDVEGWYTDLIAKRLTSDGCEIQYQEVWEFIHDHHRKYRAVAPPPEPESGDSVDSLAKELIDTEALFLRQLELLRARATALEKAAHYYSRARVARDRWLEQAAVARRQITNFVTELQDHWSVKSDAALRDIDETSNEAVLRSAGWTIHDSCMDYQAPFGPHPAPKYLTSGSYHILADEVLIGWHPNYHDLLETDDGE